MANDESRIKAPATSTSPAISTGTAPAKTSVSGKTTLTFEEFSTLERRMQTEDPATITLPNGETFKDYLVRQERDRIESARAEQEDFARKVEAGEIVIPTSSVPAGATIDMADNVLTMTPTSPTVEAANEAGLPISSSDNQQIAPAPITDTTEAEARRPPTV